jgi:hypothetical protein
MHKDGTRTGRDTGAHFAREKRSTRNEVLQLWPDAGRSPSKDLISPSICQVEIAEKNRIFGGIESNVLPIPRLEPATRIRQTGPFRRFQANDDHFASDDGVVENLPFIYVLASDDLASSINNAQTRNSADIRPSPNQISFTSWDVLFPHVIQLQLYSRSNSSSSVIGFWFIASFARRGGILHTVGVRRYAQSRI